MRGAGVLVVVGLMSVAAAQAETLTLRDAAGRKTGTVEEGRDGRADLRDAMGRRTGSFERSGGDLIRRDVQGRKVETIEGGARGRR